MHYVFDAFVGESGVIKQVSSSQYSPSNSIRAGRGSGAVDPSLLSVVSATPQATLQTSDLAGILTLISISAGLAVDEETALVIPYNKAANGGTFDTDDATVLSKTANGQAVLYIQQIAASGDGDAIADVMAMFASIDGLSVPVDDATGETISGQTFTGLYSFGGVAIGSAVDSRATGVTVNTGITLTPWPKTSGYVYPTALSITQRNPYIDIEFADIKAAASDYGPNFAALASAVAYFRLRADGGTFASGSSHVSITSSGGIIDIQQIQGTADSPGSGTVRLWCKGLTSSTAAAIPSYTA